MGRAIVWPLSCTSCEMFYCSPLPQTSRRAPVALTPFQLMDGDSSVTAPRAGRSCAPTDSPSTS